MSTPARSRRGRRRVVRRRTAATVYGTIVAGSTPAVVVATLVLSVIG